MGPTEWQKDRGQKNRRLRLWRANSRELIFLPQIFLPFLRLFFRSANHAVTATLKISVISVYSCSSFLIASVLAAFFEVSLCRNPIFPDGSFIRRL